MNIRTRVLSVGTFSLALLLGASLLTAAPASAATATIASDTMTRRVAQGWGTSDAGSGYVVTPVNAGNVAGGSASLKPLGPGRSARALLKSPAAVNMTSQVEVTLDARPKGSARAYVAALVRSTSQAGYAARLVVTARGAGNLEIGRYRGFTFAVLSRTPLPFTVQAGRAVAIKVAVAGQSPTVTVSAKAWNTANAEPSKWLAVDSDHSSARVKSAGTIGVVVYASSGVPVVPVRFDNLRASATVTAPAKPVIPPTKPVTPPVKPTIPPTKPTTPVTPPKAQTPPPADKPATDPAKPTGTPAVVADYPGKRGDAGAASPGTLSYPVPAGAIFVAPNGSDSNNGTQVKPVATIAQALQLVKNHGTVVLRAGNYHESVFVIPRTGVTIQPYPNEAVWLDGAESLAGWKKSGTTWVKDGWTTFFDASPTYARGKADGTQPGWQWLDPARPMAAHPDQIWIDGVALMQVPTRSAVTTGTFFVDQAAKQLVIGTDPTSRTVEASTLSKALTIRATDSNIRGIGVRRYATSVPEMGTVTADQPGITLTDVTIVDNATTGFYTWASGVTLNRVTVARNGLLGAGASQADGLSIDGMLSVGNNAQGFNRAPVSGALKITRSRDIDVTGSSFVNNAGQGPWFDESVYDITFTDNDVWGSGGYGVVIELSEKAVVANNLLGGNGKAGILIANSGNVSVWNNTMVGNATAPINITQDDRRASNTSLTGHDPRRPNPDPTVPWIVSNVQTVNNVISASDGECLICVRDWSREFLGASMVSRSDGNVYHRSSTSATDSTVLWSRGSDGTGTYSTFAEYVNATGRDKTSTLIDGGTLLDANMRIPGSRSASFAKNAVAIPDAIARETAIAAGTSATGVQGR